MDELELKLQVPADRRTAVEAAVFDATAASQTLRASYFDTVDRCLAANGIALRLREESGQWVQTLKVGGVGRLRRLEHNVPLDDFDGADSQPQLDPARHAGTAASRALQAALDSAEDGEPALHSLYSTDIVRRSRLVEANEGRVEIAFDSGAITANGQWIAVCEIELELKGGSPAALVILARRLVLEHGLWLSTRAKSARGDRLSRGTAHPAEIAAQPPAVRRGMGGLKLLHATLDACLQQVLANASEVADGSTDETHVHQLRVGIRRLRTALRELGPFAEGLDAAWEEALVGAFRELGQVRDRETVIHAARSELAAAGAPDIELTPPEFAAPDIAHAVRAVPVQMALLGLIGFAFELETRAADSAESRRKSMRLLRHRLGKLHRQVARAGKRFEKLPIETQHQVRKRLKRLRYLSEFLAPLFPARAVDRYLDALRPAQEALGRRNDVAIALDTYRDAAVHDPNAWFAVGWLSAQQDDAARRCCKTLAAIDRAPRFWKE